MAPDYLHIHLIVFCSVETGSFLICECYAFTGICHSSETQCYAVNAMMLIHGYLDERQKFKATVESLFRHRALCYEVVYSVVHLL
jgi:hypothetical protein